MQVELKQVIYVSKKTDFSGHSLTKIFDASDEINQKRAYQDAC